MQTTIASFLLLVVTGQEPSSDSDVVARVTCTEIAFSQSAERRDRDGFAEFLHPDARFVSSEVSRGPAAILVAWSRYFDPDGPSIRWRPEHVEVNEEGTLALSRGVYRTVQMDDNGERQEVWGRFISVWRRGDDGRWLIQFDTGADHGMTPSDDERRTLETETQCDEVG